MKAVMTRQDGSSVTVFSNAVGTDLLKHESDSNSDRIWWYRFDENGRKVRTCHPSSIDLSNGVPYNESALDLAVAVKANEGRIELLSFYDETDNDSGAAIDRLESSRVQRGLDGAPVVLSRTEYITSVVNVNGDFRGECQRRFRFAKPHEQANFLSLGFWRSSPD